MSIAVKQLQTISYKNKNNKTTASFIKHGHNGKQGIFFVAYRGYAYIRSTKPHQITCKTYNTFKLTSVARHVRESESVCLSGSSILL